MKTLISFCIIFQIFFLSACSFGENANSEKQIPLKNPQNSVQKIQLSTGSLIRTISEKIEGTGGVDSCDSILDDGDRKACMLSILIVKGDKKGCRVLSGGALIEKCENKIDFRNIIGSGDIQKCESLTGSYKDECSAILTNMNGLFQRRDN